MINMNLITEMDNFQREIEQLFSGAGLDRLLQPAPATASGRRDFPRIDVREEGQSYLVEALLPGVDTENLEMTVVGSTLTIAGEKRREVGEDGRTWHLRERRGGKFARTVELPAELDRDRVSADYSNGVLSVSLPKAERAMPKKIAVNVN